MICHRRKFIFVHIGKNGGQSVRKALRSFAFSRTQRFVQYIDIRTLKRDPFGVDQAGSHPSVSELRTILGADVYESYYSFSFVRNPWSRLQSFYHFSKLRPKSQHHDAAMTLDFSDFVEHTKENGPIRTQSSLILDANGTPQVDFVGRFENLTEDFATVCGAMGCDAVLPHKNKTKHRDYRTAYTQKAADTVARLYADDIKYFGYSFD